MMDRRAFLAATPLVFGLESLLAQEASPAWISDARRRMKDSGRFGLLLVAPEADPLQRRVGLALWNLTRSAAVRGLLAETVLVCVLPAHARTLSAQPGRLVLLSPDGAPASSAPLAVETLEDPARFAAAVDFLLRDEGRREKQAAAVPLSDDLRASLDRLDVDDLETREKAFADVAAAADRIAPLLAHLARTGRSEEYRGRAAQALARVYERAADDAPGPKLPYGALFPPVDLEGTCTECGKSSVPDGPPRRFLRFLSK